MAASNAQDKEAFNRQGRTIKRLRRNKAAKLRQPKQMAHAINEIWSMDFVADALFDGRKLRMLTVVDLFTRECLAIEVAQSL